MKARLLLALLALIGPLAFAPAPLPRRDRGRADEINLTSFQGRWRITKRFTLRGNGKHTPRASSVTHIRIVQNRWTFMTNDSEGSTLEISIDPSRKPALLNFYRLGDREQRIYGVGLIRKRAVGVEVLYHWGGPEGRPLDFEPPPDGFWTIEMYKE